jgi:hypothetical protein
MRDRVRESFQIAVRRAQLLRLIFQLDVEIANPLRRTFLLFQLNLQIQPRLVG